MKVGDIVYFKEIHSVLYTSGKYYFKPGVRYKIETLSIDIQDGIVTGHIRNLEDGKLHFFGNKILSLWITQSEWREKQLNQILD
jgi:hypothetical protein